MNMGKAIRALRKMNNVTQVELARRIGLSRTSVVNMEQGRQVVTEDKINAIAEALGYTVHIAFKKKRQA